MQQSMGISGMKAPGSLLQPLLWLYALFLAGYFLFPQAPEHYKYYYIFVVLPLVILWRSALEGLAGNTVFRIAAAYCLYMTLSGLWSTDFNWHDMARVTWWSFLVLVFLMATHFFARNLPGDFERLFRYLVALATITALLSITVWYWQHPFPQARLESISRMDNPVLAGCAYGLIALLATHYVQTSHRRGTRILYGMATLTLVCTVLLTQSRTALVALIAAVLLMAGNTGRRLVLALVILAGLLFLAEPSLWQNLLRCVPYRPGIWQATFDLLSQQLVFGLGYLSPSAVIVQGISFPHAHSAYLATLRDGGLIGLLLLFALLAVTAARAIRLDRGIGHPFYSALLIYAALCAVPDLDRLLTRPKEHWLFFWLPIALIMATQTGKKVPAPRETG